MSNEHRTKLNARSITASALAVILALSATSALARAMSSYEGDDDDAPGKTQACNFIGCANGNRVCGTATGKITSGAPPFVGEIAVSWTCYESGPAA